jgi:redox-sensitive bicupin YhaK (pirin superfamily)
VITVVDAKKLPAHVGSSALAAPVGPDHAPRTVGPFAIVVHAKIPDTAPGALPVDLDVRPHPHIGLIAISYVLEGAVTHRDSLGFRRELQAGDLGATISGRGVVHPERFDRKRVLGGAFEMMQLLLALPDGAEEVEPSFVFLAKSEIPSTTADGATVRWLCASPPEVPAGLATTTPILLAAIDFEANGRWAPPEVPERALYVRTGAIEVGDARVGEGRVAILAPGATTVRALEPSHVIAFGGTTVGERWLWWNYIHSSRERIDAAKAEWRSGRAKLPDGDTESFTPCPPDDGRPLRLLNERTSRD